MLWSFTLELIVDEMIKVENLTKIFGTKRAVDGVSFSVERGEVLGFLGPNGAGKSTTMRMLTGFLPPTSGRVTVGGYDIGEDPIPAKKLLGYLPESAPAYTDMTVYGFLNFAAEIRGLRGGARKAAVNRVVDLCFLDSVLHQNVDTLSKGYRHRTCFAQSIIHDPDILVLDEPTDGLDPNQKHEIRQLIRKMGEQKAIIFSTHILEEVDAACTRAIIIDRGVIVANGTPEELRRKSEWAGAVTLRVHGVGANEVQDKLKQLRAAKKVIIRTGGMTGPLAPDRAKETDGRDARATTAVTVTVFPRTAGDGDLTREVIAATNGWQVSELRTEEGRLDEVFYNITMPDTKSGIRNPKSEIRT